MKKITITLKLSELIYDVQNKTYLTGKSRRSGSNHEQVANMQANDDDENANQILRSISMAYATLKTKLSEYMTLMDSSGTNELLSGEGELSLELQMPSNYNTSTVDTLVKAAHEYVVSVAISDWFTITDKADASDYSKAAESALAVISEAAHKRLRPVREA